MNIMRQINNYFSRNTGQDGIKPYLKQQRSETLPRSTPLPAKQKSTSFIHPSHCKNSYFNILDITYWIMTYVQSLVACYKNYSPLIARNSLANKIVRSRATRWSLSTRWYSSINGSFLANHSVWKSLMHLVITCGANSQPETDTQVTAETRINETIFFISLRIIGCDFIFRFFLLRLRHGNGWVVNHFHLQEFKR